MNQHRKPKEEEEQELLNVFKFFDGDNSSFIDTNYFKKEITCFGDKISEEDFNNFIQQVIMDNTNERFDYRDLIQIILGFKKEKYHYSFIYILIFKYLFQILF